MSLLTRQKIVAAVEGQLIKLIVGEFEVRMEYETALQVSQMLRACAKHAKDKAGDRSRHWSAVGVLSGLDEKELVKAASFGQSFNVGVK